MNISACTVLPISSATKTFRLLPAGHFKASDGRPKDVADWYLDGKIAATLIEDANARTTDFVIDYEHQTLQSPTNGKPAPAAGWFHKLEWREGDGLYVVDAQWTDAATKMLAEHEYRYISPVFQYDGKNGNVQRIVSAALTNNPALDGLTDLAAATSVQHARRVELNGASANANEVLRRVFGKSAVTVEDAAALSRTAGKGGIAGQKAAAELEAANAKIRELFGPDAVQLKQIPPR